MTQTKPKQTHEHQRYNKHKQNKSKPGFTKQVYLLAELLYLLQFLLALSVQIGDCAAPHLQPSFQGLQMEVQQQV